MYQVFRSSQFEKSFQRIKHGGLKKETVQKIEEIIDLLISGEKLLANYRDHQLKGNYKEFRECHIQGDLLLVYKKENKKLILILIDIGSHSYLF
jgi:mRNA interferase YafQ